MIGRVYYIVEVKSITIIVFFRAKGEHAMFGCDATKMAFENCVFFELLLVVARAKGVRQQYMMATRFMMCCAVPSCGTHPNSARPKIAMPSYHSASDIPKSWVIFSITVFIHILANQSKYGELRLRHA